MPKVIYVGEAGDERAIDATLGESVMATAVKNGVPGIIGECGGNASCATCHVWVDDEFLPLVGTPATPRRTCWTSASRTGARAAGCRARSR